jgi:hypothetical protein
MNSATILANSDITKLDETIYEGGLLTMEREHFYKINDNSFDYFESI